MILQMLGWKNFTLGELKTLANVIHAVADIYTH